MAKTHDLDVVIIGGGPAGYVGAIRAAQLGLRTACVEKDRLGGVCNNWGCIPTKALLAAAELYQSLKHDAGEWGILAPNVSHDWSKVIARSRGVADLGDKGVGALFKKNKVTHLKGAARIAGRGKVEVRSESGEHTDTLLAKHIVIATGARPRELPGAPFDGQRIISSKEAMSLGTQPRKLLIIGAGAIGAEFAYFYNAFGTQVTLIEMMPRLLPIEDDDVCKAVEKSFTRGGITCLTAHKTLRVEKTKAGVQATVAPAADEK
jgi:dihydrolipoamide dehydrogenase